MKKFLILFISAGMLLFSSCNSLAPVENFDEDVALKKAKMVKSFKAHLSGDQEVPPAETNANGQVNFKMSKDGDALHFKLIVANINDVFAAHIHLAPEGINGPVVVALYTSGLIAGQTNGILAEGVITAENLVGPLSGETLDDLISELEAGNAYVNVHTSVYRGGEIRGQISSNN
ncbi:CHRD domain-containing protein [Mariniphaga sp.]|uniref:CHRD domain-containing protein n=1 Tax=Mariniphaga sp. TaxID=1954475 RepID=UPI0035671D82